MINSWEGGMLDDLTAQANNGVQVAVEVDIHDKPGVIRPSWDLVQESTTTALVTAMDNFDGDGTDKLYGFDGSIVYKRTSGTWSTDRTLSGTTALTDTPEMLKWSGSIWYASKTTVGKLTGTTYDDDYLTAVVGATLPAQDAAWKPMKSFLDKLFIGDGRWISSLDTTEVFTQKALTLPAGYRIRAMELINDRLAIACGSDSATTGDSEKTAVFIWDGTSDLFESKIDVDCVGGIQALKSINNTLYLFTRNVAPPAPAGIDMYVYNGSDFEVVKTVPCGPSEDDSCRMYPNAVANFNDNLLFGTTKVSTTDATQRHGVWKWGRANINFQRSLVLDNLVSTNEENDVTIGAIKVWNNLYYVSNKTGSTYRIDQLSTTIGNDNSYIETQVYDVSNDNQNQLVKGVKLFCNGDLPSGTSIVVKYAIDGAAFSTLGTITSSNQADILYGIYQTAFTIELRLEFVSNGTALPEVFRVGIY